MGGGGAWVWRYALVHLRGYALPVGEIKRCRQWGSKTPGHPEYGLAPGVEATTGPLGQGFANGVGMAIAERWLAEHYNRPGHEIINHHIYAIVSAGDLEERAAPEAPSLRGPLRRGEATGGRSEWGSWGLSLRRNLVPAFVAGCVDA